ncbi:hypothetical protein [Craterilacuibacter sp.]|uniref:hypothetical protein n=1 Tax=Craterilacuibacter sp. TaxID=2870909 RepID=UPI003F3958A8
MKPLLLPVLASALLLAGCAGFDPFKSATPVTITPKPKPEIVAPATQGNSERLLFEANRLAEEVKASRMNRTQAADALGRARLAWVGRNSVDDEVFRQYRQLAVARDTNLVTPSGAHNRMFDMLKNWQRRWLHLSPRPADPAFTNFLMKVYSLPPLQ